MAIAFVRSQQISGVIQRFDLVLGLLIQPLVLLGNAIGVPHKHQIFVSLVDILQGGTRL